LYNVSAQADGIVAEFVLGLDLSAGHLIGFVCQRCYGCDQYHCDAFDQAAGFSVPATVAVEVVSSSVGGIIFQIYAQGSCFALQVPINVDEGKCIPVIVGGLQTKSNITMFPHGDLNIDRSVHTTSVDVICIQSACAPLQYAGGIAQFNAKGVAIFRNVAFVTASVEQRVVLGNPFLMSVSGRVLNVACTVCAPARLDITLLWAGAQQWATAVDHDIGYNLTFAIADALGIEVGNVTLMRVVALSSDTDMATIPITILLISTIISQSYADLLQRPAAHLELMHAVSAKGLRFNSTGMVVAGAKPPFKCRLQVSQRVSKYTDYLHEGQSFQMEIRRVDCRGQDVACPPFPVPS
jgi:hypothetical protein